MLSYLDLLCSARNHVYVPVHACSCTCILCRYIGTHVHVSHPAHPVPVPVGPARAATTVHVTTRPVPRELVMPASCSPSSLASGTALSSLMTLCYSSFSLCGKLLCFIALRLATMLFVRTGSAIVHAHRALLMCGDAT